MDKRLEQTTMEQALENSRKEYIKYYNIAQAKKMRSKTFDEVRASHNITKIAWIKSLSNQKDSSYMHEAEFYQLKFQNLQAVFLNDEIEKWNEATFNLKVLDIFYQKEFRQKGQRYEPKSKIGIKSDQNEALSSFFEQKKSKIVPEVGFKSILQNPSVSNKSFRKKVEDKSDELNRLRAQNVNLKKKMQSKYLEDNDDIFSRQEDRIRDLEHQNQILDLQNKKLESQSSIISASSSRNSYAQSLYTIEPLENDLQKIKSRNCSEPIEAITDQNHFQGDSFNGIAKKRDIYSNYEEAINDQSRYSVFDMSKSYYSEQGDMNTSKIGIDNARTSGKNKAAFFRKAGVLIRQNQLEVAYKRTDPEQNFSTVRVILYYNNRTGIHKTIKIDYEYQNEYYDLFVKERISEIKPFKQGREVIEVKLKSSAKDINSVIEAVVEVDGKIFKLWVPAMFIKIESKATGLYSGKMGSKTIHPHKSFKSAEHAKKIIQDAVSGKQQLVMWGKSRFQQGPINLLWKHSNKLTVKAPENWVDFLSFIMFDYR